MSSPRLGIVSPSDSATHKSAWTLNDARVTVVAEIHVVNFHSLRHCPDIARSEQHSDDHQQHH